MNQIIFFLKGHYIDIGFIIAGSIGVIFSIKDLIITFKSINWKETKGFVIWSNSTSDGDGSYMFSLEFFYIVEGKRYISNKFYPSVKTLIKSKKETEKLLLSIGQNVTVYYNPKNPQKSCLFINKGYGIITTSISISISSIIIGILLLRGILTLVFE